MLAFCADYARSCYGTSSLYDYETDYSELWFELSNQSLNRKPEHDFLWHDDEPKGLFANSI